MGKYEKTNAPFFAVAVPALVAADATFHVASRASREKSSATGEIVMNETHYTFSRSSFFSPTEILECVIEPFQDKPLDILPRSAPMTHRIRLRVTNEAAARYNAQLEDRSFSIFALDPNEMPLIRLYFTDEKLRRREVLRIPEKTGLLVLRFTPGKEGYSWCATDQK